MLASMSSREFSEWIAFNGIEPIGDARRDMQAAVIAQTIAEVNRNERKRKKPFSLLDFMPIQYAAKRAQRTAEDVLREFKAAFGR